jgi:predicted lysophospholipase L1 biosynthesis ABC-type transport system permease subunit
MESKNYHEDLLHIRSMMERSSRFISLSGLSGVVAGLAAIIGAVYVYFVFQREGIDYFDGERNVFGLSLVKELVMVGVIILVVALHSGYIITANKSRRKGLKIWDATTRRLLVTFAVPLVTGGFFCLALLYHHLFVFIAPATLLFYGLALVSAERYTLTDIKYLGYCQIILGLISLFFLGWGLLFWAIGFGALHIVYGLIMHKKYK